MYFIYCTYLELESDGTTHEMLNTINNVTIGLVVLALIFVLFVGLMKVFHSVFYFKGSDIPNYSPVFQYVQSVIDFWTDVLFAYSMYLKEERLYFGLALTFTALPLICSVVLIIYWIYRWRTMTSIVSQRITDYLQRYSMSLILLTLFGNFGSAMGLVRSRFMLSPRFMFSLKKTETERLKVWKFVNVTLLEVLF